ncbi:MAG TPA: hypothetical protein VFV92_07460 [Candidatus Bathyarchaeia archaeon]|nr:hypothetical protein [Candidatus Bathyarchaeia archaeon]
MAYRIQFEPRENILCFEVIGSIRNHIDSLAKYVMYRIANTRMENVLLDLRSAADRPGPAKLFIHVLRYPVAQHITCALIDLERNREFVSLYAKLVQPRGHKIRFFDNPEEGTSWLQTKREDR